MRIRRRKIRLADMAALTLASLLLAIDLMVRDPQPIVAAAPQGEIVLTITLILMAFGLFVRLYGLYHDWR